MVLHGAVRSNSHLQVFARDLDYVNTNTMVKESVKQACKVCYDNGYNLSNIMFKRNLNYHCENASIRQSKGKVIPCHVMDMEYDMI